MPQIITFRLSDNDSEKLKRLCGLQNISCRSAEPKDYFTKLGELAGGSTAMSGMTGISGAMLPKQTALESLILMCDFSDSQMDALLAGLRQNNISVDFKAILTDTNRNWNYIMLLSELRRESLSH
jgi:hypothetical protein